MKVKYIKKDNINYKFFEPDMIVKKVILAIHGFAGDAESSTITSISEELSKHGVMVVAFDLPCHGNNTNNDCIKLSDCFLYLDKVINEIKKQYDNIPISVFATSFGAFVLLNYISKTNIKFNNIILRCPAIFMDEILIEKILPEHGYNKNDLNIFFKLNLGFEKPLYVNMNFLNELQKNSLKNKIYKDKINIIQGTQDDIVNVSKNENFYKNNFLDYKLFYIEGADHRFKKIGELDQVINIVKNIIL